jgi:Domain of unknown function (4846)
MHIKLTFSLLLLCSFSCNNNASSKPQENKIATKDIVNPTQENDYKQIKNIPLPNGYERIKNADNSFAAWLENIALKKDKTVYKFDGKEKYNQTAQFAVLDISIGKKDLQQCADAVMRLRAEYLFAQKKFGDIIFRDNGSGVYTFSQPYTRENFTHYLDKVFGMCGTASLAKQLKQKNNFSEIKAGDVLIRGGFPGHAVMVMNVAENADGKRIYMIAQSYMPAQDIHVLQNPMNENLSPWYEVNKNDIIQTPEYSFRRNELMQW